MVVTGNYVPCFVGCLHSSEALLFVDYCPCHATLIFIMDKQATPILIMDKQATLILIGNTGCMISA
jgi:hypothetical protein